MKCPVEPLKYAMSAGDDKAGDKFRRPASKMFRWGTARVTSTKLLGGVIAPDAEDGAPREGSYVVMLERFYASSSLPPFQGVLVGR